MIVLPDFTCSAIAWWLQDHVQHLAGSNIIIYPFFIISLLNKVTLSTTEHTDRSMVFENAFE